VLARFPKTHDNVGQYTSFFDIFMENALVNSLLRFRKSIEM
jgi:hypothetical protein